MNLTFCWKIHKPSSAAAVKRINVRNTHLMEGLSNPVIVTDAFGERSMKRGYLITT
jgi:hypothetical protein